MVAGLTLRGLWSAAKAAAVRTEFEMGFALRLRTNKSCVHQNSSYPAVVTFLYLLLLLLLDTLHAVVFAIREAHARIA